MSTANVGDSSPFQVRKGGESLSKGSLPIQSREKRVVKELGMERGELGGALISYLQIKPWWGGEMVEIGRGELNHQAMAPQRLPPISVQFPIQERRADFAWS